jgi:paraquat-inducible protein B
MSEAEAAPPPLPEPVLARQNRARLSLVWIVPIVAVIIGAVLVVRSVLQAGPEITIELRSAEGIEPGRTQVRFKEVAVGVVKGITIRPDRQRVRVVVNLDKSAESLAVDDTRFWVVRPRIGSGGVSGLGTLLSGVYIGLDAGESTTARREFVGLDVPPLVLRGEPGRSFVLQADDLGSLDVGASVYHRRIRVGRVLGYSFVPASRALDVQVFVQAPHDELVTQRTRFWHASGVDLSISASGLTLQAQSLASVIAGGVAFDESPSALESTDAALPGQRFRLFENQRSALSPDSGDPLRVRMVFAQSLRGLHPGAPVDLLGIEVGSVRSFELLPDASSNGAQPVEVIADLYPLRLGRVRARFAAPGSPAAGGDRRLLAEFVQRGLRAQARGNVITGRMYIALDFVPKATKVAFDAGADVPTVPTLRSPLSDAQTQLAEIVARLSRVRFDQVAGDVQEATRSFTRTGESAQAALDSADALLQQLSPQAQDTLAEVRRTMESARQTLGTAEQTLRSVDGNLADSQAPLQRSVEQTMAELQRAAQALRVLADYLQRNPQSLLRGKPAEAGSTESR